MEIPLECIPEQKQGKMSVKMSAYPDEQNQEDIVSDTSYFDQVHDEFGLHALRGTAIGFHNKQNNMLYSTERVFRSFVAGRDIKHCVEIGTWRGVSTAFLAHYAEKVTTIDLVYYPEAMPKWLYFGVLSKIKYNVVENNEAKQQVIDRLDFDFAFIDGAHQYEQVEIDFLLAKRCGRVLFHDYGIDSIPEVTQFIETLPESELRLRRPFAYWESNELSDIR